MGKKSGKWGLERLDKNSIKKGKKNMYKLNDTCRVSLEALHTHTHTHL